MYRQEKRNHYDEVVTGKDFGGVLPTGGAIH